MKFLIEDQIPCYVTFRRVVEADTAEEAEAAWLDGDSGEELPPVIGDSIDFLGNGDVTVEPYAEAA